MFVSLEEDSGVCEKALALPRRKHDIRFHAVHSSDQGAYNKAPWSDS